MSNPVHEQIRTDFIARQWKRYSSIPTPSQEWVPGRFLALENEQLTLLNGARWPLALGSPSKNQKELGPQMPLAALKKGDVVLLNIENSQVSGLYLLSPCLEEWSLPQEQSYFLEWQQFLEEVRSFFKAQGFIHWKTPTLLPSPGVDAHIDFYKATGVRTQKSFYLPSSPELELKKAISQGHDKVFEIKSCFRDDDLSNHHRPEFTMIEWYRSYADKWTLLKDMEPLFSTLSGASITITKRSIATLFQEYVGLELSPRTAKQELSAALTKHGLDQSSSDDWDDLFFRLYIELIEKHLGQNGPEAIYHFPATQGSLARTTQEGWADRFEIYWNGVEIANAYQEQTDPALVEVRVRSEVHKRQKLGREPNGIDEEFLKMMKSGFPPCAGIALGLDRLFMVLKKRDSL